MQTARINAMITAYSTVVGPSSSMQNWMKEFQNCFVFCMIDLSALCAGRVGSKAYPRKLYVDFYPSVGDKVRDRRTRSTPASEQSGYEGCIGYYSKRAALLVSWGTRQNAGRQLRSLRNTTPLGRGLDRRIRELEWPSRRLPKFSRSSTKFKSCQNVRSDFCP